MKLLSDFLKYELSTDPAAFLHTFSRYEELLLTWNKKINLISRDLRTIEDLILNSIFFLKEYKIDTGAHIADIGTGGGFPGIPLKILYPDLTLNLIDSVGKKTMVLDDIIKNMNLQNTAAINSRAEELSLKQEHKGKYDIVISKSVAHLDKLFLWSKNFINPGGEIICIKGGGLEEEIAGLIRLMKGHKMRIIDFNFDNKYNIEGKKLVVIKKL